MTMAMAAPSPLELLSVLVVGLLLVGCIFQGAEAWTVFNFVNLCNFPVWVGLQPNGGIPLLANGGFQLLQGAQQAVTAPAGWGDASGDAQGVFLTPPGWGRAIRAIAEACCIATARGQPPASLAEITLDGANGYDFYDISLVDGYNLPINMQPIGGTSANGTCGAPGCISNLNLNCPTALQLLAGGAVVGCKSACDAFGLPQYCCTGAYGAPSTCTPTKYSLPFKAACPTAYSYAYDDATSTFTCKAPSGGFHFLSVNTSGIINSSSTCAYNSPVIAGLQRHCESLALEIISQGPNMGRMWKKLPWKLLLQVLTMLPIAYLCRFRVVSKNWNRLISHPKCASLHAQASSPEDYVLITMQYEWHHDPKLDTSWEVLDVANKKFVTLSDDFLTEFVTKDKIVDFSGVYPTIKRALLAANGGLFCLCYTMYNTKGGPISSSFVVCNPFLRTVKELPTLQN